MFFSILLFIGLVYCLMRVSKLSDEVELLKKGNPREADHQHQSFTPSQVIDMTVASPKDNFSPRPQSYDVPNVDSSGPSFDALEWIKKDFLVKLGAFLLLIALGWFVSYAFANNWVGPVGRIMLGILLGVGFMLGGIFRSTTDQHQGAIFTVLGSTIVLLTVFAGRELYEFFTPITALLVMFLSVALVAKLAVVYKSRGTAISGLILAGVAPLLTNVSNLEALVIFPYLLVVVLGSLWILFRINSPVLQLGAFLLVLFYSLPYLTQSYYVPDMSTAIAFGFIFTTIFLISNLVGITLRSSKPGDINSIYLTTAIMLTVYLIGWIEVGIADHWKSIQYIVWALVFAGSAFVTYRLSSNRTPFYVYGAISLGLLGAATAAVFAGPALTLAYTIEITILIVIAKNFFTDKANVVKLCWLYALPIILSFDSIDSYSWHDSVLHEDFFILMVLMICLVLSSVALFSPNDEGMLSEDEKKAGGVLAFIASVYAVGLVWLISHALLTDDIATMISLFIYTVVGLILYVRGKVSSHALATLGGKLLIGFVVVRLLVVDVWSMEMTGRIVTFLIVGILLISTAFIKKLKSDN